MPSATQAPGRPPDYWLYAELHRYCGGEGGKPGPCPSGAGGKPKKLSKAEQRRALYESLKAETTARLAQQPAAVPAPAAGAPSAPFSPHEHLDTLTAAVKEHGGSHNLAPLLKVRGSLGHLSRAQQDAVIHEARRRQLVSGSDYEGRHGVSPEERAAGIPQADSRGVLGFLSLRQHSETAGLYAELSRFCQEGQNKGKPGPCPETGKDTPPHGRERLVSHLHAIGQGLLAGGKEQGQQIAAAAKAAATGGAAVKAAAGRLAKAGFARLPEGMQHKLARTYAVAKAIEHKVMLGFTKGKELAQQVARERGLPESHVERVGKVLATADLVSAWTVNFPAVTAITGSAVAGKAASWVPVASLAYLGYSTARNPLATIRAARKLIAGQVGAAAHDEADTAKLFAGLEAAGGQGDWYLALVHAALDRTHDLGQAIDAAGKAFAAQGTDPAAASDLSADDADLVPDGPAGDDATLHAELSRFCGGKGSRKDHAEGRLYAELGRLAGRAPPRRFSEGNGRIHGVEVFASGVHRGKEYTDADLDDMVKNFKRFSWGPQALLKNPAVVGHEEKQELLDRSDLPAAGWAERVWAEMRRCPACAGNGVLAGEEGQGPQKCALCAGRGKRKVLLADFHQVPDEVAPLINGHALRKVSAEVYDDPSGAGLPGSGKTLRRIAFLGGDVPEVKGLADIPRVTKSSEGAAAGTFAPTRRVLLQLAEVRPSRAAAGAFWCFSETTEATPMNRQEILEQLAGHGIDTSAITDAVPDEALAEMLRVCDAKDHEGEEGEFGEGDGDLPEAPEDQKDSYAERARAYGERVRRMAERGRKYLEKYCSMGKMDDAIGQDTVGTVTPNAEPPTPASPTMPQQPSKITTTQHFSEAQVQTLVNKAVKAALDQHVAGSVAQLQKFREEYEASEKLKTTESAVDARVKAGRLPPAEREHTIALLMGMDAKKVEKFSEGGKVKSMTAYDRFLHMIDARPSLFSERFKQPAPGGKAGGKGDDDEEVAKVQDTFERFSEVFPRGTKVETLVKGFRAERKHNAKLTAADFLDGFGVPA